jgi:hypothetical protein
VHSVYIVKGTFNLFNNNEARMQDGDIKKLIDKYLNGTATPEEAKLVDDWYASFEDHQGFTGQSNTVELEKMVTESFDAVLTSLKLKSY